jgi:hypothetical protein
MQHACPPEVSSSEKRLNHMQLLVKKQLEIVEKCKRQTEEAVQQLLDMQIKQLEIVEKCKRQTEEAEQQLLDMQIMTQGVAMEHAFSWKKKKEGDEHPTFLNKKTNWRDEYDVLWMSGPVLPFFGHTELKMTSDTDQNGEVWTKYEPLAISLARPTRQI